MGDFKAIETKEELDKVIQKELEKQKQEFVIKKNDLETQVTNLQKIVDESQTTISEHEKTVSDLNSKISDYQISNLRTKIAVQSGLPLDLAERLQGDDEESLKEDAERFSSFVGNKEKRVAPLKTEEPSLGDGKHQAYKNLIKNTVSEGE